MKLDDNNFQLNLPGYHMNLKNDEVTDKSNIHFHLGYSNHRLFEEHLLLFELFPRKGVKFHYKVEEYYSPSTFSSDESKSSWEDLTARTGDFTGDVVNRGQNFSIKSVMDKVDSDIEKDFDVDSYYVVGCYKDTLSTDFKSKCDTFTKSVVFDVN